jgi:hypothetical protein
MKILLGIPDSVSALYVLYKSQNIKFQIFLSFETKRSLSCNWNIYAFVRARASLVAKALCDKSEGRGFIPEEVIF